MGEALAGASRVQESVPERLDLKHVLRARINGLAPAEAVIGSSTSGFKPSELNERGARVIVEHPFNPAYLLPLTYFQRGLHGWALYVIVGLCLASFSFRKKLPLTIRAALHPILGERIYGPWGHAVDLLAIFDSVFGIATPLCLGASQMVAGLNVLFGLEPSLMLLIGLIVIVGPFRC